jgi:hypothetical protein
LNFKGKKFFDGGGFFRISNHKAAIKSTSIVNRTQMKSATNGRFFDDKTQKNRQNGRKGRPPSWCVEQLKADC